MRMHKLIVTALALAGVLSCSKQNPGSDQTLLFSFTVSLETDIKAIADGASATQLLVGVLDADGTPLDGFRKVVTRTSGEAFTFDLQLVEQMEYTVLLFAQSENRFISSADYLGDNGSAALLFAVPLPETMGLNQEQDDAFTGVSTFTGASSSVVLTLTRAWGQVNIASSLDISSLTTVSLTIPGLPSHFDVRTGESASGATSQSLTITGAPLTGETFHEGVTDYNYIGYAYVPIGKTLLYTSPTLTLTRSGPPSEITLGSIPLRANYRTNILGGL